MPLKPCKRPVRNAVMPRRRRAMAPPSPYALGAPAPSSGWRVHQQCRHCRHLLSLLRRLVKVSGDARPDGRQPAFAWGDVAHGRNPYPPHYRMAFASSILPFPHAYRLALRLTFPCGRHTGFPCSVSVTTNGVGALCPPVALLPMTRKEGVLVPATVPFWLKPSSTFGLFSLTMFIERSPGFAIPSILAPLRRSADRYIGPSRVRCQSGDCGFIVRRLCTGRYLPAHLRRIPLMGQRVVSWHYAKHNND